MGRRWNRKPKSARKGKKPWRWRSNSNISSLEASNEKASLSGRPLDSLPSDSDNSLFFAGKSTDVDARRKNPSVEFVPCSTLKKKRSASKDASFVAGSKVNEVGGKRDPGTVVLWSDGGRCNTKKVKKCQDMLGHGVADEMRKVYQRELGPQPVQLSVVGGDNDNEEIYFMDADSRRKDNVDEETPAGDAADTTTENSISNVMQEIDEGMEEIKNRNLRLTVAKQDRFPCPPRIGKCKLGSSILAPVEVLSEEISGSLLKPQGCSTVARDCYESHEKRGLAVLSSKKIREGIESKCRVVWADLPAELLAMICEGLKEGCDKTRFRGVCQSWRSSLMTVITPNKISPLFPRTLPHWHQHGYEYRCTSHPRYLVASAVYYLRSFTNKSDDRIVSVQESEPGKLLLRHALTSMPIPGSSGLVVNLLTRGLTPTRLSIYYSFHSKHKSCATCLMDEYCKLVIFPNPSDDSDADSVTLLYLSYGNLFALERCLSNHPRGHTVGSPHKPRPSKRVEDVVDFNGRVYAVDSRGYLSVLDRALDRLILIASDNSPVPDLVAGKQVRRRFVVSDGDLYIVCNFCEMLAPQQTNLFKVYKLVMTSNGLDDAPPASCSFERVVDLGDKLFYLNKHCSFSVSARDLAPPFLKNCIVMGGEAFPKCWRSCIYHLGDDDNPPRMELLGTHQKPVDESPLFHLFHPSECRGEEDCVEAKKKGGVERVASRKRRQRRK